MSSWWRPIYQRSVGTDSRAWTLLLSQVKVRPRCPILTQILLWELGEAFSSQAISALNLFRCTVLCAQRPILRVPIHPRTLFSLEPESPKHSNVSQNQACGLCVCVCVWPLSHPSLFTMFYNLSTWPLGRRTLSLSPVKLCLTTSLEKSLPLASHGHLPR